MNDNNEVLRNTYRHSKKEAELLKKKMLFFTFLSAFLIMLVLFLSFISGVLESMIIFIKLVVP